MHLLERAQASRWRSTQSSMHSVVKKLNALCGLIINTIYRHAIYALIRNDCKRLGGLRVKLNALCGKKALRYQIKN